MKIFTDGSSLSNHKEAPAGSAVYFVELDKTISYKFVGTNNQAELLALDLALWYLFKNNFPTDDEYLFYLDSEYVIKIATKVNKPRSNHSLVENILKKLAKLPKHRFIHVKAHTKNNDDISKWNDIVDKKAKERAEEMKRDLEISQNQ